MRTLREFALKTKLDKIGFLPGDIIHGDLYVYFEQPVEIQAIEIFFTGIGCGAWLEQCDIETEQTVAVLDSSNPRELPKRRKLVDIGLLLYGFGEPRHNKAVLHEQGRYVYEFEINIPAGIPYSFKSPTQKDLGYARYYLKAALSRPKKRVKLTKIPIIINELLDPDRPDLAFLPGSFQEKNLRTACLPTGSLSLECHLSKSHYIQGEKILIQALAQNCSPKVLKEMYAKLVRRVRCKSSFGTNTFTSNEASIHGTKIPAQSTIEWKKEELKVPPVGPTIAGNREIRIDYMVRIGMYEDLGCEVHLDLPVVIGTVGYSGGKKDRHAQEENDGKPKSNLIIDKKKFDAKQGDSFSNTLPHNDDKSSDETQSSVIPGTKEIGQPSATISPKKKHSADQLDSARGIQKALNDIDDDVSRIKRRLSEAKSNVSRSFDLDFELDKNVCELSNSETKNLNDSPAEVEPLATRKWKEGKPGELPSASGGTDHYEYKNDGANSSKSPVKREFESTREKPVWNMVKDYQLGEDQGKAKQTTSLTPPALMDTILPGNKFTHEGQEVNKTSTISDQKIGVRPDVAKATQSQESAIHDCHESDVSNQDVQQQTASVDDTVDMTMVTELDIEETSQQCAPVIISSNDTGHLNGHDARIPDGKEPSLGKRGNLIPLQDLMTFDDTSNHSLPVPSTGPQNAPCTTNKGREIKSITNDICENGEQQRNAHTQDVSCTDGQLQLNKQLTAAEELYKNIAPTNAPYYQVHHSNNNDVGVAAWKYNDAYLSCSVDKSDQDKENNYCRQVKLESLSTLNELFGAYHGFDENSISKVNQTPDYIRPNADLGSLPWTQVFQKYGTENAGEATPLTTIDAGKVKGSSAAPATELNPWINAQGERMNKSSDAVIGPSTEIYSDKLFPADFNVFAYAAERERRDHKSGDKSYAGDEERNKKGYRLKGKNRSRGYYDRRHKSMDAITELSSTSDEPTAADLQGLGSRMLKDKAPYYHEKAEAYLSKDAKYVPCIKGHSTNPRNQKRMFSRIPVRNARSTDSLSSDDQFNDDLRDVNIPKTLEDITNMLDHRVKKYLQDKEDMHKEYTDTTPASSTTPLSSAVPTTSVTPGSSSAGRSSGSSITADFKDVTYIIPSHDEAIKFTDPSKLNMEFLPVSNRDNAAETNELKDGVPNREKTRDNASLRKNDSRYEQGEQQVVMPYEVSDETATTFLELTELTAADGRHIDECDKNFKNVACRFLSSLQADLGGKKIDISDDFRQRVFSAKEDIDTFRRKHLLTLQTVLANKIGRVINNLQASFQAFDYSFDNLRMRITENFRKELSEMTSSVGITELEQCLEKFDEEFDYHRANYFESMEEIAADKTIKSDRNLEENFARFESHFNHLRSKFMASLKNETGTTMGSTIDDIKQIFYEFDNNFDSGRKHLIGSLQESMQHLSTDIFSNYPSLPVNKTSAEKNNYPSNQGEQVNEGIAQYRGEMNNVKDTIVRYFSDEPGSSECDDISSPLKSYPICGNELKNETKCLEYTLEISGRNKLGLAENITDVAINKKESSCIIDGGLNGTNEYSKEERRQGSLADAMISQTTELAMSTVDNTGTKVTVKKEMIETVGEDCHEAAFDQAFFPVFDKSDGEVSKFPLQSDRFGYVPVPYEQLIDETEVSDRSKVENDVQEDSQTQASDAKSTKLFSSEMRDYDRYGNQITSTAKVVSYEQDLDKFDHVFEALRQNFLQCVKSEQRSQSGLTAHPENVTNDLETLKKLDEDFEEIRQTFIEKLKNDKCSTTDIIKESLGKFDDNFEEIRQKFVASLKRDMESVNNDTTFTDLEASLDKFDDDFEELRQKFMDSLRREAIDGEPNKESVGSKENEKNEGSLEELRRKFVNSLKKEDVYTAYGDDYDELNRTYTKITPPKLNITYTKVDGYEENFFKNVPKPSMELENSIKMNDSFVSPCLYKSAFPDMPLSIKHAQMIGVYGNPEKQSTACQALHTSDVSWLDLNTLGQFGPEEFSAMESRCILPSRGEIVILQEPKGMPQFTKYSYSPQHIRNIKMDAKLATEEDLSEEFDNKPDKFPQKEKAQSKIKAKLKSRGKTMSDVHIVTDEPKHMEPPGLVNRSWLDLNTIGQLGPEEEISGDNHFLMPTGKEVIILGEGKELSDSDHLAQLSNLRRRSSGRASEVRRRSSAKEIEKLSGKVNDLQLSKSIEIVDEIIPSVQVDSIKSTSSAEKRRYQDNDYETKQSKDKNNTDQSSANTSPCEDNRGTPISTAKTSTDYEDLIDYHSPMNSRSPEIQTPKEDEKTLKQKEFLLENGEWINRADRYIKDSFEDIQYLPLTHSLLTGEENYSEDTLEAVKEPGYAQDVDETPIKNDVDDTDDIKVTRIQKVISLVVDTEKSDTPADNPSTSLPPLPQSSITKVSREDNIIPHGKELRITHGNEMQDRNADTLLPAPLPITEHHFEDILIEEYESIDAAEFKEGECGVEAGGENSTGFIERAANYMKNFFRFSYSDRSDKSDKSDNEDREVNGDNQGDVSPPPVLYAQQDGTPDDQQVSNDATDTLERQKTKTKQVIKRSVDMDATDMFIEDLPSLVTDETETSDPTTTEDSYLVNIKASNRMGPEERYCNSTYENEYNEIPMHLESLDIPRRASGIIENEYSEISEEFKKCKTDGADMDATENLIEDIYLVSDEIDSSEARTLTKIITTRRSAMYEKNFSHDEEKADDTEAPDNDNVEVLTAKDAGHVESSAPRILTDDEEFENRARKSISGDSYLHCREDTHSPEEINVASGDNLSGDLKFSLSDGQVNDEDFESRAKMFTEGTFYEERKEGVTAGQATPNVLHYRNIKTSKHIGPEEVTSADDKSILALDKDLFARRGHSKEDVSTENASDSINESNASDRKFVHEFTQFRGCISTCKDESDKEDGSANTGLDTDCGDLLNFKRGPEEWVSVKEVVISSDIETTENEAKSEDANESRQPLSYAEVNGKTPNESIEEAMHKEIQPDSISELDTYEVVSARSVVIEDDSKDVRYAKIVPYGQDSTNDRSKKLIDSSNVMAEIEPVDVAVDTSKSKAENLSVHNIPIQRTGNEESTLPEDHWQNLEGKPDSQHFYANNDLEYPEFTFNQLSSIKELKEMHTKTYSDLDSSADPPASNEYKEGTAIAAEMVGDDISAEPNDVEVDENTSKSSNSSELSQQTKNQSSRPEKGKRQERQHGQHKRIPPSSKRKRKLREKRSMDASNYIKHKTLQDAISLPPLEFQVSFVNERQLVGDVEDGKEDVNINKKKNHDVGPNKNVFPNKTNVKRKEWKLDFGGNLRPKPVKEQSSKKICGSPVSSPDQMKKKGAKEKSKKDLQPFITKSKHHLKNGNFVSVKDKKSGKEKKSRALKVINLTVDKDQEFRRLSKAIKKKLVSKNEDEIHMNAGKSTSSPQLENEISLPSDRKKLSLRKSNSGNYNDFLIKEDEKEMRRNSTGKYSSSSSEDTCLMPHEMRLEANSNKKPQKSAKDSNTKGKANVKGKGTLVGQKSKKKKEADSRTAMGEEGVDSGVERKSKSPHSEDYDEDTVCYGESESISKRTISLSVEHQNTPWSSTKSLVQPIDCEHPNGLESDATEIQHDDSDRMQTPPKDKKGRQRRSDKCIDDKEKNMNSLMSTMLTSSFRSRAASKLSSQNYHDISNQRESGERGHKPDEIEYEIDWENLKRGIKDHDSSSSYFTAEEVSKLSSSESAGSSPRDDDSNHSNPVISLQMVATSSETPEQTSPEILSDGSEKKCYEDLFFSGNISAKPVNNKYSSVETGGDYDAEDGVHLTFSWDNSPEPKKERIDKHRNDDESNPLLGVDRSSSDRDSGITSSGEETSKTQTSDNLKQNFLERSIYKLQSISEEDKLTDDDLKGKSNDSKGTSDIFYTIPSSYSELTVNYPSEFNSKEEPTVTGGPIEAYKTVTPHVDNHKAEDNKHFLPEKGSNVNVHKDSGLDLQFRFEEEQPQVHTDTAQLPITPDMGGEQCGETVSKDLNVEASQEGVIADSRKQQIGTQQDDVIDSDDTYYKVNISKMEIVDKLTRLEALGVYEDKMHITEDHLNLYRNKNALSLENDVALREKVSNLFKDIHVKEERELPDAFKNKNKKNKKEEAFLTFDVNEEIPVNEDEDVVLKEFERLREFERLEEAFQGGKAATAIRDKTALSSDMITVSTEAKDPVGENDFYVRAPMTPITEESGSSIEEAKNDPYKQSKYKGERKSGEKQTVNVKKDVYSPLLKPSHFHSEDDGTQSCQSKKKTTNNRKGIKKQKKDRRTGLEMRRKHEIEPTKSDANVESKHISNSKNEIKLESDAGKNTSISKKYQAKPRKGPETEKVKLNKAAKLKRLARVASLNDKSVQSQQDKSYNRKLNKGKTHKSPTSKTKSNRQGECVVNNVPNTSSDNSPDGKRVVREINEEGYEVDGSSTAEERRQFEFTGMEHMGGEVEKNAEISKTRGGLEQNGEDGEKSTHTGDDVARITPKLIKSSSRSLCRRSNKWGRKSLSSGDNNIDGIPSFSLDSSGLDIIVAEIRSSLEDYDASVKTSKRRSSYETKKKKEKEVNKKVLKVIKLFTEAISKKEAEEGSKSQDNCFSQQIMNSIFNAAHQSAYFEEESTADIMKAQETQEMMQQHEENLKTCGIAIPSIGTAVQRYNKSIKSPGRSKKVPSPNLDKMKAKASKGSGTKGNNRIQEESVIRSPQEKRTVNKTRSGKLPTYSMDSKSKGRNGTPESHRYKKQNMDNKTAPPRAMTMSSGTKEIDAVVKIGPPKDIKQSNTSPQPKKAHEPEKKSKLPTKSHKLTKGKYVSPYRQQLKKTTPAEQLHDGDIEKEDEFQEIEVDVKIKVTQLDEDPSSKTTPEKEKFKKEIPTEQVTRKGKDPKKERSARKIPKSDNTRDKGACPGIVPVCTKLPRNDEAKGGAMDVEKSVLPDMNYTKDTRVCKTACEWYLDDVEINEVKRATSKLSFRDIQKEQRKACTPLLSKLREDFKANKHEASLELENMFKPNESEKERRRKPRRPSCPEKTEKHSEKASPQACMTETSAPTETLRQMKVSEEPRKPLTMITSSKPVGAPIAVKQGGTFDSSFAIMNSMSNEFNCEDMLCQSGEGEKRNEAIILRAERIIEQCSIADIEGLSPSSNSRSGSKDDVDVLPQAQPKAKVQDDITREKCDRPACARIDGERKRGRRCRSVTRDEKNRGRKHVRKSRSLDNNGRSCTQHTPTAITRDVDPKRVTSNKIYHTLPASTGGANLYVESRGAILPYVGHIERLDVEISKSESEMKQDGTSQSDRDSTSDAKSDHKKKRSGTESEGLTGNESPTATVRSSTPNNVALEVKIPLPAELSSSLEHSDSPTLTFNIDLSLENSTEQVGNVDEAKMGRRKKKADRYKNKPCNAKPPKKEIEIEKINSIQASFDNNACKCNGENEEECGITQFGAVSQDVRPQNSEGDRPKSSQERNINREWFAGSVSKSDTGDALCDKKEMGARKGNAREFYTCDHFMNQFIPMERSGSKKKTRTGKISRKSWPTDSLVRPFVNQKDRYSSSSGFQNPSVEMCDQVSPQGTNKGKKKCEERVCLGGGLVFNIQKKHSPGQRLGRKQSSPRSRSAKQISPRNTDSRKIAKSSSMPCRSANGSNPRCNEGIDKQPFNRLPPSYRFKSASVPSFYRMSPEDVVDGSMAMEGNSNDVNSIENGLNEEKVNNLVCDIKDAGATISDILDEMQALKVFLNEEDETKVSNRGTSCGEQLVCPEPSLATSNDSFPWPTEPLDMNHSACAVNSSWKTGGRADKSLSFTSNDLSDDRHLQATNAETPTASSTTSRTPSFKTKLKEELTRTISATLQEIHPYRNRFEDDIQIPVSCTSDRDRDRDRDSYMEGKLNEIKIATDNLETDMITPTTELYEYSPDLPIYTHTPEGRSGCSFARSSPEQSTAKSCYSPIPALFGMHSSDDARGSPSSTESNYTTILGSDINGPVKANGPPPKSYVRPILFNKTSGSQSPSDNKLLYDDRSFDSGLFNTNSLDESPMINQDSSANQSKANRESFEQHEISFGIVDEKGHLRRNSDLAQDCSGDIATNEKIETELDTSCDKKQKPDRERTFVKANADTVYHFEPEEREESYFTDTPVSGLANDGRSENQHYNEYFHASEEMKRQRDVEIPREQSASTSSLSISQVSSSSTVCGLSPNINRYASTAAGIPHGSFGYEEKIVETYKYIDDPTHTYPTPSKSQESPVQVTSPKSENVNICYKSSTNYYPVEIGMNGVDTDSVRHDTDGVNGVDDGMDNVSVSSMVTDGRVTRDRGDFMNNFVDESMSKRHSRDITEDLLCPLNISNINDVNSKNCL